MKQLNKTMLILEVKKDSINSLLVLESVTEEFE